MSAVITSYNDFRMYQSARDYGKRAGIPQREAVYEVASAKRAGISARVPVSQLQHRAIRAGYPKHPGGDAA